MGKLRFDMPYQWNSAVVAAAFAVTPMDISGILGSSNVTLMQVKDYDLTSDIWILGSWTYALMKSATSWDPKTKFNNNKKKQ